MICGKFVLLGRALAGHARRRHNRDMEKFLTYSFNDAEVLAKAGGADRSRGEKAFEELGKVLSRGGYDDPASSINLPNDEAIFMETKKIAGEIKGDSLAHVLLIGIGGSNLGAQAVYEALRALPEYRHLPQMYFADTVSPLGMENLTSSLLEKISSKEEVAIVVISKSGTTTETAANAAYFLARFEEKFGDMNARIATVTDSGSVLDQLATARGWRAAHIPAPVGGRYSVFSPAGMLSLLLAGFPVEELREGARSATEELLGGVNQSAAFSFAHTFVAHSRSGMRTHNLFLFEPALESVGKWWRQLIGESLGKEKDMSGAEVHEGILPVVSIGSTDLHSVGQLYLGGPKNIFTTFVTVGGGDTPRVPAGDIAETLVPGLVGKDFSEIMSAIAGGTKRAYTEQGLPSVSIHMPVLSPQALGAFMQTQMIATMIMGRMLEVDPFDQPSVERYKEETRGILHGG